MCLCTIGRSTRGVGGGGGGGMLPRRATKLIRAGRNNELKTLSSELLHYLCSLFVQSVLYSPLPPVPPLFPSLSSPCFVASLFLQSLPLSSPSSSDPYRWHFSLPPVRALLFPSSSSPCFVISLFLQSVLCHFSLPPVRALLFLSSSSPRFVISLFLQSALWHFPLPPVRALTFPSSSSPRFDISLFLQSALCHFCLPLVLTFAVSLLRACHLPLPPVLSFVISSFLKSVLWAACLFVAVT